LSPHHVLKAFVQCTWLLAGANNLFIYSFCSQRSDVSAPNEKIQRIYSEIYESM